MKMSECIQYINQALNYPALVYEDISLFFDMAIAELNTTLHTSLPMFSQMTKEYEQYLSNNMPNKISLDINHMNDIIPVFNTAPTIETTTYYYDTTKRLYGIYVNNSWKYVPMLYGVYSNSGQLEYLQSYLANINAPVWVRAELNPYDFEIGEFLPNEWILLWIIPYVCFKYTCRDGGTASTFAEEMSQGFQQLQETYSVPSEISLTTYAGRLAYTDLVKQHLDNLNIKVPTRAIYEDMKHDRGIKAIFGSVYDAGGFGI